MKLVLNARRDPTRTATLRAEYASAIRKRFNALKRTINETVVDNDALGLSSQPSAISGQSPSGTSVFNAAETPSKRLQVAAAAKRYDFPSDPAGKAQAFMDWLYGQADEGVLEIEQRDGRKIVMRNEWQNVYVRAAYTKGMQQADTILKRTGMPIPEYELWQVLRQPMHADTIGMLYVRNFDELKGITEAMGQQIARELSEGMAKGLGMKGMAKAIATRVDKVGIYRGTLLARTEIVRAHAEATLNRFEEFGLEEVGLQAEWMTAGDQRVCPICGALQGQVYKIAEARGMLPRHPQCRCSWLPVLPKGMVGNRRIWLLGHLS